MGRRYIDRYMDIDDADGNDESDDDDKSTDD